MGSNRSVDSNKAQAEVQRNLINDFDVSISDLYATWKGYANRKLDGKKDIIGLLRDSPLYYNPKAIDYFAALGFELFTTEFLKEAESMQKELELG